MNNNSSIMNNQINTSFGGDHGLSRIDSLGLFLLGPSSSFKMNDFFGQGNSSFNVAQSNSRYELNRQATNMSQMSVGCFKMSKEVGINQNGEVIISTLFDPSGLIGGNHLNHNINANHNLNNNGYQNNPLDDFMHEVDDFMFNNNGNHQGVNVSKPINASALQGSDGNNDISVDNKNINANGTHPSDPFKMTQSIDVDPSQLSTLKQLMGKSKPIDESGGNNFNNNTTNINNNHFLGESASSNNHRLTSVVSLNLSQMMSDRGNRNGGAVNLSLNPFQYLNNLNNKHHNNTISVKLVDSKLETHSEPDIEIEKNANIFFDQHYQADTHRQQETTITQGRKMSTYQLQQQDQIVSFNDNQSYVSPIEKPYAYSDDEGEALPNKRKVPKVNRAGGLSTQPAKPKSSQYRQSRHKNVFKNFGGTLVRFIVYNQHFQERVIAELDRDAQKQKAFHDWLQNKVKLERKKDFQIAWTTFTTDSDIIREFKALLRELSKDFFENFSFIYLINSKKISDMEIHLRSIHTYLAAINQPDSLERFKPV